MNGIHDMGGLHGFGEVPVETDEPVFHARWEGRIFAMTQVLDTTGIYNLDEHRHEIELMHPADYLRDGYYGRWLFAMERILDRKLILRRTEVDRRLDEQAANIPKFSTLTPQRQWPLTAQQKIRWGAQRPEEPITPSFAVGDRVRVRNLHHSGHTRLTAYVRGRAGVVSKVNAESWIYPDTRAHNVGDNPQAVYNVTFDAQELWGDAAEPGTKINVDLSEAYLEHDET
ncbi:nitrile hydratase subunit beta [Roseibium aquae]|uniref:Nitrile hydratase subunit beta n=1 Tax=Roseibium aquae TaxID=1323746 RepID=A0A916TR24_9HYPH|nr:nitrile hydratase subunit beta [Roseibium aquae]GGB63655.1 nitrile hydratase subunit beta [Roseibium aquae]